MITVREAQDLIINNAKTSSVTTVLLKDALGTYLAEDVIAPISLPPFDQSAMDGYAIKFQDKKEMLKVVNSVPAGDNISIKVNSLEAVRIYTGSKVPDNCDTVVMQEWTAINGNNLAINDSGLQQGANIRKAGNQCNKGDLVLKKGTQLNPGTIGFLANMGIEKVKVYSKPKVAIIATGNELVKPGKVLKEGQVYESNTAMLTAALQKMNITSSITKVKDDRKETINVIKIALTSNDLILLSGGISVGDYDFVKEGLEKNGVQQIFYKVKQKPGKPLYFGKKENTYVLALPGNPASALTCFYEYAVMTIRLMMGAQDPYLTELYLPIAKSYTKKAGRAIFLKALLHAEGVVPLDGQASDALQAFSNTNGLIFLEEKVTTVNKGDRVEVHLLP